MRNNSALTLNISNGWPNCCGSLANKFISQAPAKPAIEWMHNICSSGGKRHTYFAIVDGEYRRTEKMARLEAALLVAEGALSTRKLTHLATLADAAEVRQLIEQLNIAYDETGSAFRIERVATGFQLLTRPEFSPWLSKLHERKSELKLSPPALETMTIVAYRQPVTRADVEAIRGVQCSEMLKQLMERGLVRVCGEDDSLGRPYLYGTTRQFLELYGLCSLKELPMSAELKPKAIVTPSEDELDGEDWEDEEE